MSAEGGNKGGRWRCGGRLSPCLKPALALRRRKRDTEGFGEESREPTTGNGGEAGEGPGCVPPPPMAPPPSPGLAVYRSGRFPKGIRDANVFEALEYKFNLVFLGCEFLWAWSAWVIKQQPTFFLGNASIQMC